MRIGLLLAVALIPGCVDHPMVERSDWSRGYVAALDGIRVWESADAPQPGPAPAPQPGVCPSCNGTGKQTTDGRVAPGPCPDCNGTGRIGAAPQTPAVEPPKAPDPHAGIVWGQTTRVMPHPQTREPWLWRAKEPTTTNEGKPAVLWVPLRPANTPAKQ